MAVLRRWAITLGTAAVTAAVLLGAALVVDAGPSSDGGTRAAADRGTPTPPRATASGAARPSTGDGPEGVPLPGGVPLGPAGPSRKGLSQGGIPCGSGEQLRWHVHARLTVFVNGRPRAVPLGIGVGRPWKVTNSDKGAFVSEGSCFSFLHTHAADGVIHIEAPAAITFKLGQFFDLWGQRLDPRHLGRTKGRVVAYVDGKRYRGDPRGIQLRKHAQIQLELGQPHVSPELIEFPRGL